MAAPGGTLWCPGQLQISDDRMVIRVRQGKFSALQDIDAGVSQDIIDTQGGGNMDIGPADAKTFFNKSIPSRALDRKISIGIGDIVEIPANNGRVRAFVQLLPHFQGLLAPQAEGEPELLDDGLRSRKNTVIDIFDDLQVMKILAAEQHRLQMRGKDPYRIAAHMNIRCDQAFRPPDPIRPPIAHEQGIRDRVT